MFYLALSNCSVRDFFISSNHLFLSKSKRFQMEPPSKIQEPSVIKSGDCGKIRPE